MSSSLGTGTRTNLGLLAAQGGSQGRRPQPGPQSRGGPALPRAQPRLCEENGRQGPGQHVSAREPVGRGGPGPGSWRLQAPVPPFIPWSWASLLSSNALHIELLGPSFSSCEGFEVLSPTSTHLCLSVCLCLSHTQTHVHTHTCFNLSASPIHHAQCWSAVFSFTWQCVGIAHENKDKQARKNTCPGGHLGGSSRLSFCLQIRSRSGGPGMEPSLCPPPPPACALPLS